MERGKSLFLEHGRFASLEEANKAAEDTAMTQALNEMWDASDGILGRPNNIPTPPSTYRPTNEIEKYNV